MTKHTAGFTLIETMVYLGLFSIIIGGGLVTTYQIIQSSQSVQNKILLQEEGNFLLAKINWTLTGIKTINQVTATTLSVTKYDSLIVNPLTLSLNQTDLQSNRTGSNLNLNASNITITSLQFTHLTQPTEGVKVQFTLTSKADSGQSYSQNFETVKYLR